MNRHLGKILSATVFMLPSMALAQAVPQAGYGDGTGGYAVEGPNGAPHAGDNAGPHDRGGPPPPPPGAGR